MNTWGHFATNLWIELLTQSQPVMAVFIKKQDRSCSGVLSYALLYCGKWRTQQNSWTSLGVFDDESSGRSGLAVRPAQKPGLRGKSKAT